jgi:peroxiredoxin
VKIALKIIVPLLALALGVGYLFREPLKDMALAALTQDMFVASDDDHFDPGPALGSRFPGLQASYKGHPVALLEEFAGPRGTALIASRSIDWCPYCMRQLIQLQENKAGFDAAGIGMVAITYDRPDVQQAFIDKFQITIPVLSDSNALTFKTLGILNTDYAPGDFQYGIPHPGIIVVDSNSQVVGKLFLEDYSSRVDAAAALAFARTALGIASP